MVCAVSYLRSLFGAVVVESEGLRGCEVNFGLRISEFGFLGECLRLRVYERGEVTI